MTTFSSNFISEAFETDRAEHPSYASVQTANLDENSRLRKRITELDIALRKAKQVPDSSQKPPAARQNKQRPDAIHLSDPKTPGGQTPGAMLLIMQMPMWTARIQPNNILPADVGDIVEYIAPTRRKGIVKVKHFRTGEEGVLQWRSFGPVNARNMCACQKANCYCLYENFRASENFVDKFDEYRN